MKKKLLAILCAVIFALGLVGCFAAKEKTFEKAEMQITLTEDFGEKEYISFTSVYVSQDVMVFTLKEDAATFQQAGMSFSKMTLDEYAKMVIKANGLSVSPTVENGLTCFVYEKTVSAKDYVYYACVYKSTDGFWLIQFATEQADFEELKPQLCKYAQSVTFETQNESK